MMPHALTANSYSTGWNPRTYRVRTDDGEALWFENRTFGRDVDVVVLPLAETDVGRYHYDLKRPEQPLVLAPLDQVAVVGFPYGQSIIDVIAVWTRGFIATEPALDYAEKPLFLLDARTRQGQSGSPVVFTPNLDNAPIDGPSVQPPARQIIGVYSGRVNEDADLGFVWKIEAVREILTDPRPGQGEM